LWAGGRCPFANEHCRVRCSGVPGLHPTVGDPALEMLTVARAQIARSASSWTSQRTILICGGVNAGWALMHEVCDGVAVASNPAVVASKPVVTVSKPVAAASKSEPLLCLRDFGPSPRSLSWWKSTADPLVQTAAAHRHGPESAAALSLNHHQVMANMASLRNLTSELEHGSPDNAMAVCTTATGPKERAVAAPNISRNIESKSPDTRENEPLNRDESAIPNIHIDGSTHPPPPPPPPHRAQVRALSARQERRLTDALDALFLELTRGFKMRCAPRHLISHPAPHISHFTSHFRVASYCTVPPHSTTPSSPLRTLCAYLSACTHILPLILLTPPASTRLRAPFLLRYTAELLGALPGYAPDAHALPALLGALEALDAGWCAVLRGEAWDAARGKGVAIEDDDAGSSSNTARGQISETERVRLRSALVTGMTRMEEWLEGLAPAADEDGNALDVRAKLGRLGAGLRVRFEALFARTLGELGFGDEEDEGVQMTALVQPGALRCFGDGEGAGAGGLDELGEEWFVEVDDVEGLDADGREFDEC
jgi:hypothetical protein